MLFQKYMTGFCRVLATAFLAVAVAPPQYLMANGLFVAENRVVNNCAAPVTRNDAVCQGATAPAQGGLLATTAGCGQGSTVQWSWWTAAQGGTKVADGAVFNPIATGTVNPQMPAVHTFWAQYTCTDANGQVCTSSRTSAIFSVKSTQLSCLGQINTVLTPFCTAVITARSVLTGDVIGVEDMRIQLLDGQNRVLEEGIGSIVVDGMSNSGARYEVINRTYTYRVTEPCFNSFCTGTMQFSDRIAPILTAPRDTALFCALYQNFQNPDPIRFGEPIVNDCSRTTYTYTDRLWETDCKMPYTAFPPDLNTQTTFPSRFNDIIKIIERTFLVRDIYGNQSSCRQLIFVKKGQLSQVICPQNLEFECQTLSGPLTLAQTGSPMLDIDGLASTTNDRVALNEGSCTLVASYRDDTFRLCRNSYKIFRTWTLRDLLCTTDNPNTATDESVRLCSQVIHISDKTPPRVLASFSQYYGNPNGTIGRDTTIVFNGLWRQDGQSTTASWQDVWALGQTNICGAQAQFILRATDPSCTQSMVNFQVNDSRVQLLRGYPIFNPNSGETVAIYTISLDDNADTDIMFTAGDECGFAKAQQGFRIRVRDNIMPQAACVGAVRVTLDNTGWAQLSAQALNAGSTDNCGIAGFKVRRLAVNGRMIDTAFSNNVFFSCEDAQQTWPVLFQVTDGAGLTNTCTVWVSVDDKTKPTCLAPPQRVVSCTDWRNTPVNAYGTPVFWDNCRLVDTVYSELQQLDNCGTGTVIRKWVVRDAAGWLDSCTQTIICQAVSDFIVDFPDDKTVACAADVPSPQAYKQILLNNPPTVDGHIINRGCGSIGIDIQDDTLTGTGFCYKILRKISVIDFCKLQSGPTPEGCMAKPVCGDVHSNPTWAQTNSSQWPLLTRPACTQARERRFQEADALATENPAFADGVVCFTQIITIIDTTAPVFSTHLPDTLIENYADNCQITVNITAEAADLCSNNTSVRTGVRVVWQLRDSVSMEVVATGLTADFRAILDNQRTYFLEWQALDGCANMRSKVQKIRVEDRKRPAIFCRNLSVNLSAVTPGVGRAVVTATQLLSSPASDNCTLGTALSARLTLAADTGHLQAYPSVLTQNWTFDCRQVGQTVPLRVWTMDAAGNADFCVAQVTVQDNAQTCVVPTTTIAGNITNENNVSLQGVNVQIFSNNTVIAQNIAANGQFSFGNLPRGGQYNVAPERNDNPLNGVTTFDLALMSKHILGIQKLASPYKILAADVNRDNDVSALDMLQTRRVILRILPQFPNSRSWRFIPKNTSFTDPEEPFANDFSESIRVDNAPENVQMAFLGFKVGDVNGSASAFSSFQNIETRETKAPRYLHSNPQILTAGQSYAVPIWVSDTEITALQGTLQWSDVLTLERIETGDLEGFSQENMGFFEKKITFSWAKTGARKGSKMMVLHFKATAEGDLADHLFMSSALTPALAFEADGQEAPLSIDIKRTEKAEKNLILNQNTPNPFTEYTEISAVIPEKGQVRLTLFDATGKVHHQQEEAVEVGLQTWHIDAASLGLPKGVLLYRVEINGQTQVKKMIRL